MTSPAVPARPLLVLQEVSKRYRSGAQEIHALRSVNATIHSGEMVGIVGPSGSGKTTLLMVAAGWEHGDAGAVRWGEDGAPGATHWNEIAMIPQRLGLLDELTVAENIGLPLLLAGRDRDEIDARTAALLDDLDLTPLAERRPAETSLGEQQRTAVARALALRPALVLADEPTGHQDARREVLVLQALRDVTSQGGACVVATHNPTAIDFCHRVIYMEDGSVAREQERSGSIDALLWGRDRR